MATVRQGPPLNPQKRGKPHLWSQTVFFSGNGLKQKVPQVKSELIQNFESKKNEGRSKYTWTPNLHILATILTHRNSSFIAP